MLIADYIINIYMEKGRKEFKGDWTAATQNI